MMQDLSAAFRRIRETVAALPSVPAADEPPPCATCGGVGWLRREVALDDPAFGRLWPCACQREALERERAEQMRRFCALPPYFADCRFDTLRPRPDLEVWSNGERSGWGALVQHCQRFAAREAVEPFLVLMGPNGTSKTSLAVAILQQRLQAGIAIGKFVNAADWFAALRAAIGRDEFEQEYEWWATLDLILLDDLGMEPRRPGRGDGANDWVQGTLEAYLDRRLRDLRQTIITTNRGRDDLGPRLESRLHHGRYVRAFALGGPDARHQALTFREERP